MPCKGAASASMVNADLEAPIAHKCTCELGTIGYDFGVPTTCFVLRYVAGPLPSKS